MPSPETWLAVIPVNPDPLPVGVKKLPELMPRFARAADAEATSERLFEALSAPVTLATGRLPFGRSSSESGT